MDSATTTGTTSAASTMSPGIIVVLATFSEKFPQQRFVSTRVDDVRCFVREGLLPAGAGERIQREKEKLEEGELEESVQTCGDLDMCNEEVRP